MLKTKSTPRCGEKSPKKEAMYQFYCWLICSHLQQVMDCLDAWLIASIDQSIENTKPSSKADMKNMSEGRSLSSQSSVVLSYLPPGETSLTLLAGLTVHLLTQLKLRSLKQSEKMFIANIRLNVGPRGPGHKHTE